MYKNKAIPEDELEELFKNACSYVKTTSGTLKSDDLLHFYARYKQVECANFDIIRIKLRFLLKEVCYKVSLCNNFEQQLIKNGGKVRCEVYLTVV